MAKMKKLIKCEYCEKVIEGKTVSYINQHIYCSSYFNKLKGWNERKRSAEMADQKDVRDQRLKVIKTKYGGANYGI